MANLVQNYAKQFDGQVARSTRTFVEIQPEISSEQIYAQMRANLVQNYLDEIAAIGNKHGGTLDKFMGDGIMGFFCYPECSGTVQAAVQYVHMAHSHAGTRRGLADRRPHRHQ
jgi:class 3 adenylate cyclase